MVLNQMLQRLDYREGYYQFKQPAMKIMNILVRFKYKKVFIQTIGSGAYGAPGSFLVQSHYHRFLFNCGEETERILRGNDLRPKLHHFECAFITSCSWNNVAGLSGMMHESKRLDVPPPIRKVYGPLGLKNIIKNYAHFFQSRDEFEDCFEIKRNFIYENNLIVKFVPLYSAGSKNKSSKNESNLKYVLAYICTFPPMTGVVSSSKLIDESVPPGPLVDCLKKGVPNKFGDGTTVTPSEVSDFCYHSSSFIVLDIPDVKFLKSLMSSSEFDKYKKDKSKDNSEENDLEIIVHLSPSEVMKDKRYRQWVNSFPSSVSHLVLNNRSSCLGLHKPVRFQLQLNKILPKVFPVHRNPGVPFVTSKADIPTEQLDPSLITSEYQFNGITLQANSILKFMFRPFKQFKSSSDLYVNSDEAISECLQKKSAFDSLEELHKKFDEVNRENDKKRQNPYPNILFLGTGSSVNSSLRSNSSILLTLSPQDCVMLDCGCHTFNQLIRLLDKDEAFSTLRNLKLIFISHKHLDHFHGLLTIFEERRKAFLKTGVMRPPPLYVLAPPDVIKLLYCVYSALFRKKLESIQFFNTLRLSESLLFKKTLMKEISDLKLKDIRVALVPHCTHSCGIALTHKDGWKIAYSGDCSFTRKLCPIGKNCDLLIHEATYEDGVPLDGETKMHCNISEALKVGRDMNAKFTILTHFSMKHPKIPLIEESLRKGNFGVAFDCMKVTFQDLPYLQYMYPTLKEMFNKTHGKNVNRQKKNILNKKLGSKSGH